MLKNLNNKKITHKPISNLILYYQLPRSFNNIVFYIPLIPFLV